jgi:hypothetical protein
LAHALRSGRRSAKPRITKRTQSHFRTPVGTVLRRIAGRRLTVAELVAEIERDLIGGTLLNQKFTPRTAAESAT